MKNPTKPISENPFYGMANTLSLFRNASAFGNEATLRRTLDQAVSEAKTEMQKQLLVMLLFFIGDIGAREPNYNKSKGQGGTGSRQAFRWILKWLLRNPVIGPLFPWHLVPQHTNFENLWYNQLRTNRKNGALISEEYLAEGDVDTVFLATVVERILKSPKTDEFTKGLIAKYLTIPKYSSRKGVKGRRKLKPHTMRRVRRDEEFARVLSEKMGWLVVSHPKNFQYVGMQEFKKTYLGNTEAHLFSSKKILEYGKAQFLNWLDQLPAGARYRVKTRLERYPQKWGSLPAYFKEWVNSKEEAQQKLRELKVKTGGKELTLAEQAELKEARKAAKVTTGATDWMSLLSKPDELAIETMLDKVVMNVPVLPVVDVSGSMNMRLAIGQTKCSDVAALLTTLTLLKNPHENGGDFLMAFSDHATVIDSRSPEAVSRNRYTVKEKANSGKLIDKTETVMANLTRVRQKLDYLNHGGTDINSIFKAFQDFVEEPGQDRQARIEALAEYPVILIISDGDFNQSYSPHASIREFQHNMLRSFGWNGVIVIWDAWQNVRQENSKFENIENVMYYGGVNPDILTQIFTKLHDLDVVDIYTPLKTLYDNDRFKFIREFVRQKLSPNVPIAE